jgi:hypothetical protein
LFKLYLATEESWNLYNVSNSSNSFTLSLEWKKKVHTCLNVTEMQRPTTHGTEIKNHRTSKHLLQNLAKWSSNTAEYVNGYLVAFMHISDNWKVICCFHLFKDLTKDKCVQEYNINTVLHGKAIHKSYRYRHKTWHNKG